MEHLVTLSPQSYWGSTAHYLPSCCLCQFSFLLFKPVFLYKQTHQLGKDTACVPEAASFRKDGLGESLKGSTTGGEPQWEEPPPTATPLPDLLGSAWQEDDQDDD